MRKIVWIGSYVSEKSISKVQELGYKNPASVTSQANILEGLETVTNSSIDTLGVLSFKGFPSDKKIFMLISASLLLDIETDISIFAPLIYILVPPL